ncbi:MAG: MarR family transcriptional regulator [Paracoccaceae bacterium]
MTPEDQLPHWINRLGFVLRRTLQQRFKHAGHNLGAEEWAVLLLLWQQDGQTPGDLARRTVRDQTTMTRLLDGMHKKHLITRQHDTKDRRRVLVHLSAEGRALEAKLVPVAAEFIAQSQRKIPPEDIETARRVLRQMSENLTETGA